VTARTFDFIVIGAGPGGYVAAIRSAQLGYKVAIVEATHLGGVCLNWGCIPTKSMLRSAEVYQHLQLAESYGLSASKVGFDLQKIVERSRSVAKQLSLGVSHLLQNNKVTVFDGYGSLLGRGNVSVKKKGQKPVLLSGKYILLATGSRPLIPSGFEADGHLIWTYRHALTPKSVPRSLMVIGSGAIGIEFASFYRALGSEVTVVEIMDQILPAEDKEIATLAQKEMEKQGVQFILGTRVSKLQKGEGVVTASLQANAKNKKLSVSNVIIAAGVVPNVEKIGLEASGVQLDKGGFIQTDEYWQTTAKGVYAIGDVAGAPCLAHKASHEAILCVEHIADPKGRQTLDKSLIPSCTFCTPQVASVGLTEHGAKEAGYKVKVGRFPARANGRAIALGETEGLVKTVFDERTGELLGAHIVGPEATEMIQGFTVAKTLETTEAELIQTIFPHPTLSEMIPESVLNAYNRAIHI
jgi:dihydrolipoamide dehydrogenase